MSEALIPTKEVAKLLNVPVSTFNSARPYLVGFPRAAGQDGKIRLYPRKQVLRWARGKDVKALVNAAHAKRQKTEYDQRQAQYARFNELCTRFARGEFATPEQKRQMAMKRLVAKTCQPKTEREQIVHDWMRE